MALQPRHHRDPYGSTDVVLAEARRMADDIRRRAQQDADHVRRTAAEWASATRREAEEHRERVLAELELARRRLAADAETAPPTAVGDLPTSEKGLPADPGPDAEPRSPSASEPGPDPADAQVIDLRTAPAAAAGPSYAVAAPATGGIDTRLSDAVRHAVRRTFLGQNR